MRRRGGGAFPSLPGRAWAAPPPPGRLPLLLPPPAEAARPARPGPLPMLVATSELRGGSRHCRDGRVTGKVTAAGREPGLAGRCRAEAVAAATSAAAASAGLPVRLRGALRTPQTCGAAPLCRRAARRRWGEGEKSWDSRSCRPARSAVLPGELSRLREKLWERPSFGAARTYVKPA